MATEVYESTLLLIREVFVYRIPPRAHAKGHRAADWDVNNWLWSGRLRVVRLGEECFIKLEDGTSGELFAQARYNEATNVVDQVTDSSRYFALTIENDRGQRSTIGIGFQERNHAFDFNVALQDFTKHLNIERDAERRRAEYDAQPKKDYSLQSGQTISINIGGKIGAPARQQQQQATSADFSIKPPPRAAAQPAAANKDDFGDFQSSVTTGVNNWATF